MRPLIAFFLCTASASLAWGSPPPSGGELLERSIAYHDASGAWARQRHRFELLEERPKGKDRRTVIEFDPATGDFERRFESDGVRVVQRVRKGRCYAELNGKTSFTPEQEKKHRLSCEGTKWLRNYYAYLFGLPMKLRDPGTRVSDEVETATFAERQVWSLAVTYDEAVGKDVWYFYFDPKSYALVGARFFHDEAKNDGELIVFTGEVRADGYRWSKRRGWYKNADGAYLGADVVQGYSTLR